jgi:protein-disulfide isomerase
MFRQAIRRSLIKARIPYAKPWLIWPAPAHPRRRRAAIERRAFLCHKHGSWPQIPERSMNRKQLLTGLVVLAVIAIGVVAYMVFSEPTNDNASLTSGGTKYAVTLSSYDRTLGNPKAPITIVEYAAPTCPHCAHFEMTLFPFIKTNYIDTGKVY